jgi:HK97 gp10 family phage protein
VARKPKAKGLASLNITGADAVIKALGELSAEISQRVLRRSLALAFEKTLAVAKENAKAVQDSGATLEALTLTSYVNKKTGRVSIRIGADKNVVLAETIVTPDGARQKVIRRPARYIHLVEKGTQPHRLGKGQNRRDALQSFVQAAARGGAGGLHPGTAPQPLLRNALDRSEEGVVQAFETEIEKQLTRAVRRLRKRAAKGS